MSSTNYLTVTETNDTKVNKRHSSFHLQTTPCLDSSDLIETINTTTNPNYQHYLHSDCDRKPSVTITHSLSPSTTVVGLPLNVRRKLSAISLPIPWHKRNRSPSEDKASVYSMSRHVQQQEQQQQPQKKQSRTPSSHKLSRERLFTLDRLFGSGGTHNTATSHNEELASPVTELTTLDESMKSHEKSKFIRENGYTNNFLHVKSRLQCTTKGTKALRLLGDGNVANDGNQNFNPSCSTKDSPLGKTASRGNTQRRLLLKNGEVNISRCNIDKRRRQYLADIFTTLIDLKWRYALCLFTLGFCLSWLAFALIWYLLMHVYGDLHANNSKLTNQTVCIIGVQSFAGAILFSIETQQTIGYGTRVVKETCYFGIVVMMVQSSIGVLLQSFMVGVVFAKISRPKKRTETLIWSREAVICLRDGRLTLQCRVGDMRKSHIVEAHVRMYLIKKRVTVEGEVLPLHTYDMNVGFDKGVDRLFLIWPLVIEHIIDEQSPLYNISRADLVKQRFELVVILEGIIESTGMTTQARTSYLPTEILWGYRFERLITFQRDDGLYRIDYSRFNLTYPVDMVTCSAKELQELHEYEKWHENNQHDDQKHYDTSVPSTATSAVVMPFFNQDRRESTL